MDEDEIYRYSELGRGYGVRVDIRLLPEYPGFVRVVGFHRNNRVIIEYYALDHNKDAAFEFLCDFQTLPAAIESIEDYLDKPLSEWTNYNRMDDYPNTLEEENLEQKIGQGHLKLVTDILHGSLKLPKLGNFKSKHELWSSLEEYHGFIKRAK